MFSLFGSSSPFDTDVEKATSETNTTEQWDLIIDICDRAGASSKNAKDCIRAIMKRIGNNDPHVAIQAITLLDSCIKNCGRTFHLEIASREFETEFQRLITKSTPPVAKKMRISLKKWAENEFKTNQELVLIPSLYQKMKNEGLDFTDDTEDKQKFQSLPTKDPNVVSSQQEEEDIAKAIELSLKEPSKSDVGRDLETTMNLYPSMNSSQQKFPLKEGRKVRALYDFEAAEENELTFYTGDILFVRDDSDPNWWSGYNDRGEGLFPSNFVTADLNAEVDQIRPDVKSENRFKFETKSKVNEPQIDESKIDRLLLLIHEASPEDPSQDSEEMYDLEADVNQMFPLIDNELELVDRYHAKLTQLSTSLVEAINMYHTLMRESDFHAGNMPQMRPQMFAQHQQMQQFPSNMMMPPYDMSRGQMGMIQQSGMNPGQIMATNMNPNESHLQSMGMFPGAAMYPPDSIQGQLYNDPH